MFFHKGLCRRQMSLQRIDAAVPDALALEHDDDDSILDDLFSSSSSSEEEEEQVVRQDYESLTRIGNEVLLPLQDDEPKDDEDKICWLFFFTVHLLIINYQIPDGTEFDVMPQTTDTDAMVRFKAYCLFVKDCYERFFVIMSTIQTNIEQYLQNVVPSHAPRIANFIKLLKKHKELHSRRIKIDPAQSRTKNDNVTPTVNLITNETYDADNDDHKTWMTLIFVPLDSDYNEDAIDAKEGGKEHELAIEVEKLQNRHHVPDPFFFVVTKEWDSTFRTMHVLYHFFDYLHIMIFGCISKEQDEMLRTFKREDWAGQWQYLVGEEFCNVPIKRFRNEKKKVPPLVSEMAEFREFLRAIVHFSLSIEKKK